MRKIRHPAYTDREALRPPEETKTPTCTYSKHLCKKTNPIPVKPLQNPKPFPAQHVRPRTCPQKMISPPKIPEFHPLTSHCSAMGPSSPGGRGVWDVTAGARQPLSRNAGEEGPAAKRWEVRVYLSASNPSFDSGDPSAPLTSAARIGGAGHSFEMGATSRSRSQGRMSESDW